MQKIEKKTAQGFVFKFLERVGAKGIYFIVSILLARIIVPDEYGIIALAMVFIEICDIFVSHGFGNALVVNQDSDDVDFSTCFYFSFFLSLILYGTIWILSDYIASFFGNYNTAQLSMLIKVLGFRLPVGAFNTVQHAFIKKYMLFKRFFWATLFGTLISGVVAVVMAYKGYGVWALVEQHLGNTIIDTIIVGIFVEWKPKFVFSLRKLKRIVNYGWKLLVVGLVDTGYAHLRDLVVGKKYSSSDLAYYSKGTTIPRTGVSVFEETLSGVFFPAVSNCNDDKNTMVIISRKVMRISTFLIFPLIVGLGAVGNELIIWMLTDKWISSVVFLEIGCLAFIFRPVQIINSCIISASGKSNLLLISDVINKCLGILLLIILLKFGVRGIALSYALTNIISTIVNIAFVRTIIPYSFLLQGKDIAKNFIGSIIMGIIVVLFSRIISISQISLKLFSEIFVGFISYCFISLLLKNNTMNMVFDYLKKRKHK